MRKLLLVLLLCLMPVVALAEAEKMPADLQALMENYIYGDGQTEYLSFTADGKEMGVIIADVSSFYIVEKVDGAWQFSVMAWVMDEMRPAYLERVADSDVPAFHITSRDHTTRLTYRYDGEQFVLAGWVIPGYAPVTVEGDVFTYGVGKDAVETIIPGGLWSNHPFSADDLPLTIEKAMARAMITEQNAAEMFPGYTLRGYVSYNDGDMAEAAYSRIEGGVLYIRRAFLEAGMDVQYTDAMPVVLSEALLTRLETKPFDSLISCWGTDTTFLTQDAFDRSAYPLPENAIIRQNRVEENSLVVLAEVAGVNYLYVYEEGSVRMSQPLPEDVYIDFFHAGSGSIHFIWDEYNMSASFVRREDGQWALSWCTCYGPEMDIHFTATAFGVRQYIGYDEGFRVGTLPGTDLFTVNLSDLTGATPTLDQTGWAVVNNPDPADRLHLRVSADKSARSLGKFYNGTPVQVLSQKGDWTQVQIGFGATARTGWMMTKYLAFRADMDNVRDAFPDLFFREEYEAHGAYLSSGYWVVGVEESGSTKMYILLSNDGGVTYVRQDWLWSGNG